MANRFRLIDDMQMAKLKPPPQLIDGIMPCKSVAVLVGASGKGKTFIALDMAFCVATGRRWLKRFPVKRGPVVYVVAEGTGGFPTRVRVWRRYRKWKGPAGVHFLRHEVNLTVPADVNRFVAAIDALPEKPALVVIDTLARCMTGGDENSAKDMGRLIQGVETIRARTNATVLLVHHTGIRGDRERGSSALRGAVDTMMFLEWHPTRGLHLRCEKPKDAEPFAPIPLRLHLVHLRDGATSCVVRRQKAKGLASETKLPATAKKALDALKGLTGGATFAEWHKASGLPKATFTHARKLLVEHGLVTQTDGKYRACSAPPDA